MRNMGIHHGNSSNASQSSTPTKHPKTTQDNNEFVQEALQVHNELRQKHGVEPLRLNNDLSKLAQQWGEYIDFIEALIISLSLSF